MGGNVDSEYDARDDITEIICRDKEMGISIEDDIGLNK